MSAINTIKYFTNFYPDKEGNVIESIFKQCEKVIIECIITFFGLDFIFTKVWFRVK